MRLDRHQIKSLLTSVANTREAEITCGDCLAGMAEFAEKQLVGAEISSALERIEAHIALCPECAEEYEVLLGVVTATSSELVDQDAST